MISPQEELFPGVSHAPFVTWRKVLEWNALLESNAMCWNVTTAYRDVVECVGKCCHVALKHT